MSNAQLSLNPETQLVTVNNASPTISVQWDRATQAAVINTKVGPTVASRAYGIVHTAMFDAWSAYDLSAVSTQLADTLQRPPSENTLANKTEAMSYAAYRVLVELFPSEQAMFDQLMEDLGFDPNNTTSSKSTAAGIGNLSAAALMQFRREDGSNQLNGYVDYTHYQPANASTDNIVRLDSWTPEFVPIDTTSNQQQFLTPQWSVLTPFALTEAGALRPVAPEPFLLVENATVDLAAGELTLADSSTVGITPDIVGTIINPAFVAQTERVVVASAELTDEQKLIAEFWEDGGGTSFPPGTWMTFGQFVSERDDHSLDEDAMLFFGLGNAVFDAGIATWEAKVYYDYVRPVRAVRELGKLGLLNGGKVGTDAVSGESGYVIDAWGGSGLGTQQILAENFLTYQTPGSDPSPPFAEYTSGHSSFSAAGAEILRLFTGSDTFGGSVTFNPGDARFETGTTPAVTTTLEWETFSEAADEAGLSRIYGGIHFDDGDLNGRSLGRSVGREVWDQAQKFAQGADVVHWEFRADRFSDRAEIGVFVVDDATGAVDGLTEDSADYYRAALSRASVLYSALPTSADYVSQIQAVSTRAFLSGSHVRFFSLTGGTVDSFLAGTSSSDISFSKPRLVEHALRSFDFEIAGIGIRAEAVDSSEAGLSSQGFAQSEVLDLTDLSGSIEVTFTLQREAAYNNEIGFYRVDDLTGQVTDESGLSIGVGPTANYVRAALNNRIENVALSVENNHMTTFSTMLEAGQMLAPYLIVNGTVEQLLDDQVDNNPAIYFPFLGANADGADHVRLFGNHTFGFEDMAFGGDQDFDDMILQVSFA